MNSLIIFFSEYFGYVVAAFVVVFLLKDYKKNVSIIVQIFGATFLSRGVFTEIIRFVWHRDRPFVQEGFTPLVPHEASASFPSGHATFFFAIGFVLYAYNKKLGIVVLVASALISFARVLAGLHWVSDIAGGALIGMLSAVIVVKLMHKYGNRFISRSPEA